MKTSILRCLTFFTIQLSHPYMTTGKSIALNRWTFVGKVMSLFFNMLSSLVIAFLSRSKHVLISWLKSPSAVILEPKQIKSVTISTFSLSICHEVMGLDAMIFVFSMLSFKPAFTPSLFTLIKKLFSSSSLSAIKVVLFAYMKFVDISSSNLIPVFASSSPAFCFMYSAYTLNKQGDNTQPWCTPFLILNQSVVPCPVLTVASSSAFRSLRRQVRWSGVPIPLRIFQFVVIHRVNCFSVVSEAKVDVFLEFSCFSCDPAGVGDLISGFSAFSKSNLYIWKFSVHPLLKSSLKDFEHYLPTKWNELNCVVVWKILCIAFLWDWNENWPFPVLWPLLSFPNLLAYWGQHFNSIIS